MWYNGASCRAPAPAKLYHTQPWFVNSFFKQKLRNLFSRFCAICRLTFAPVCSKLLSERERKPRQEVQKKSKKSEKLLDKKKFLVYN
ncbi:MAG TPA: hypothetical protein [Caudoviricetes sp.]|nr:MAG TPA: hypothetical protein [Caudoviricetes sp.]